MPDWVRDKFWKGNHKLGFSSWHKRFRNPYNDRSIKVYVFGKGKNWHFCVDDGPNGDFSYSGMRSDCPTAEMLMDRLDKPQPGDSPLFH